MKIALDISTSVIGIALDNNGIEYKQFDCSKIKKQYKNIDITYFNLYMIMGNELIKYIGDIDIDEIIIEEPLFNSANRGTVNKLITINTIISTLLSSKYNLTITHQNVNKVRSWMLNQKDTNKELDKKDRTIEILNSNYGFNLTKKENDAADAIMHLLYFNNNNNAI